MDALLDAAVRIVVGFALVRARVVEELLAVAENSVRRMSKRDCRTGHSREGELRPGLASTNADSPRSGECRSEQAGGCWKVARGVRFDETNALALADEGPHAVAAEWPGAVRAADRGWNVVRKQAK